MTRAELAAAVAPTLIALHPKVIGYTDTHAEVAKHAVRFADAILAELAKTAPKAEPTITGSGHGGGRSMYPSQAEDDEAWLREQRPDVRMYYSGGLWLITEERGEADGCGPTIAAAIRALRAKVEGGTR